MKHRPRILILLSAIAVASCHRPDPLKVAAAQHLLATCDSLIASVNSTDTTVYHHMGSVFAMQRDRFASRFRDTLGTTTAMLLGNYHRAMTGPLPQVLAGRGKVLADLASARMRITALHHDLSAGLLQELEADKALQQERGILLQLRVHTSVLDHARDAVDRAWADHTAVDSLLAIADSTAKIP